MKSPVLEAFEALIKSKVPGFQLSDEKNHRVASGIEAYIKEYDLQRFLKYLPDDPARFQKLIDMELARFSPMNPDLLLSYFQWYEDRKLLEALSNNAMEMAHKRLSGGEPISGERYKDLVAQFYEATGDLVGDPMNKNWIDEVTDLTIQDLKFACGKIDSPSERLR